MANLLKDFKKDESSSSDDRQAKVRVVGPGKASEYTEEERELLRTVAKGMLAQEQQARLLKSLIECIRIATDQKIHSSTKRSMDQLIAAQNQLKEGGMDGPSIQERLGQAHFHVWNGLVAAALEMLTGDDKIVLHKICRRDNEGTRLPWRGLGLQN